MSELLDMSASPRIVLLCEAVVTEKYNWTFERRRGGADGAWCSSGDQHSQQVPGELGGHWPGKVGQQTGTETVS